MDVEEQFEELDALLANVDDAREGDSNDSEISALQDALDFAVGLARSLNPAGGA